MILWLCSEVHIVQKLFINRIKTEKLQKIELFIENFRNRIFILCSREKKFTYSVSSGNWKLRKRYNHHSNSCKYTISYLNNNYRVTSSDWSEMDFIINRVKFLYQNREMNAAFSSENWNSRIYQTNLDESFKVEKYIRTKNEKTQVCVKNRVGYELVIH